MSETTQEVSQKEPQIERRREEKDSKFKELKTRAQMAKFEQSAHCLDFLPVRRFFLRFLRRMPVYRLDI